LVELALAGSQDAYRALVERHSRAVLSLVARMVRDEGVAEELAQDAFVKAFAALRSFDPAYKFSNWVLRIAHNVAIDHLRKSKPLLVSIDAEVPGREMSDILVDGREPSPFERASASELEARLERALAALPPIYREILELAVVAGLSASEISITCGVPPETCRQRLSRAREKLAIVLERQLSREKDPVLGEVAV